MGGGWGGGGGQNTQGLSAGGARRGGGACIVVHRLWVLLVRPWQHRLGLPSLLSWAIRSPHLDRHKHTRTHTDVNMQRCTCTCRRAVHTARSCCQWCQSWFGQTSLLFHSMGREQSRRLHSATRVCPFKDKQNTNSNSYIWTRKKKVTSRPSEDNCDHLAFNVLFDSSPAKDNKQFYRSWLNNIHLNSILEFWTNTSHAAYCEKPADWVRLTCSQQRISDVIIIATVSSQMNLLYKWILQASLLCMLWSVALMKLGHFGILLTLPLS